MASKMGLGDSSASTGSCGRQASRDFGSKIECEQLRQSLDAKLAGGHYDKLRWPNPLSVLFAGFGHTSRNVIYPTI